MRKRKSSNSYLTVARICAPQAKIRSGLWLRLQDTTEWIVGSFGYWKKEQRRSLRPQGVTMCGMRSCMLRDKQTGKKPGVAAVLQ